MPRDTLTLVGQIYDAVSEPERWSEVLDNLATTMGAHAARMRMLDKRGACYSLIAGAGHDESYDAKYAQHFTKVDVLNPVLNAIEPGKIVHSSEIIPYSEFKNTEIYNDFYRHYDTLYGIGSNIAQSDDVIARIGVHRSRSQGAFNKEDSRLLQALMPHLMRAFTLGSHLESVQSQLDGMQEALYRTTSPLMLIDEYGKVAFINQRAESLLGEESGLTIRNDLLTLVKNREQVALSELLQQAVATGAGKGTSSGGALRLTAPDGHQRYNLLVTPYPDRSVAHLGLNNRICAAIFIHDTQDAGTLPADTLKTLYDISRSELRLAEAIVEGLTPAEVAEKYGVSIHTIRTQLRSLFAKTDTQRQAELVRLLSGLNGNL